MTQISESSKAERHMTNIEKLTPFLYTRNELLETEIFKIQLMIASKNMKDLGFPHTKDVKDLHTENYKNRFDVISK